MLTYDRDRAFEPTLCLLAQKYSADEMIYCKCYARPPPSHLISFADVRPILVVYRIPD